MRIALGIEYDGSRFCGWETQRGVPTVEQAVTDALSMVAGQPVRLTCAGRTDARVHAWAQVAHMTCSVRRDMRAWVFGGNANLPKDVSITWAKPVPGDFHARFSARSRHYRYVILNRAVRPAVLGSRVCWECRPLAAERMQAAAGYLLGEHDFSSFRAVACQAKRPVRRIYRLEVSRRGSMIFIDVVANAFLHHMVRNIAGVLMSIGMGRHPVTWSREVLEARDRRQGGITAPPEGLYLVGVEYPHDFALPRVSPPELIW